MRNLLEAFIGLVLLWPVHPQTLLYVTINGTPCSQDHVEILGDWCDPRAGQWEGAACNGSDVAGSSATIVGSCSYSVGQNACALCNQSAQLPQSNLSADAFAAVNFEQVDWWTDLCDLSAWTAWSACSCGARSAVQTRERSLLWSSPQAGGACNQLLKQDTKMCSSQCDRPPVHCQWGAWKAWSECSSECTTTRHRERLTPASSGGTDCAGSVTETVGCTSWTCWSLLRQPLLLILLILVCSLPLCVIGYVLWLRCLRQSPARVQPAILQEADGDDEDGSVSSVLFKSFPSYWSNKQAGNTTAFQDLVYVNPDQHDEFDKLLRATHRPRCTQDRPCPRGTCPKTALGCPCVQVGGNPGLPMEYRVRRVIRVESVRMWRKYVKRRARLQATRSSETCEPFDPPLRGGQVIQRHPQIFEPLNASLNEAYAWHGTTVRSALNIAKEAFRIDLAGSGAGTMYGAGIYLAECCTKADEYARAESSGCYKDIYAVLLNRVCMGKFHYTTQRNDSVRDLALRGDCDSTFGDREQSCDTFRELVVYDTDQVYPEYIVLYHRVHRYDDARQAALTASQSFHMDPPIYWKNFYRDPRSDVFSEQLLVRNKTTQLLQDLVDKSLEGSSWRIVSARRVEHSRTWNRYTDYKQLLKQRLANGELRPLETLGLASSLGAAWGRSASRQSRAKSALQVSMFQQTFPDQIMCSDHMDEQLNEHLMWHGTSRSAAESIAVNGFLIPRGPEVENGKRFGRGVYFAENLIKSLDYTLEENGTSFVLLCRVACGEPAYTEAWEDSTATITALRAGQDIVVANPEGLGPREFVALWEEQVYPEYIIELVRRDTACVIGSMLRDLGSDVEMPLPPPGPPAAIVVPPSAVPSGSPLTMLVAMDYTDDSMDSSMDSSMGDSPTPRHSRSTSLVAPLR